MINFKKLLETVYEPRSGDEKNFKDKHIIDKIKYPLDTETQFTSKAKKASRKADYADSEDEDVYEAAIVHTKRADKKGVIVHDVDPHTGESKTKLVTRRTGEIKIGEETELTELKKSTLASYIGAASADKSFRAHEMGKQNALGREMGRPRDANFDKDSLKHKNRSIGIQHAANKLAAEEVKGNPYAIGMSVAMQTTGDKPPLKKSTIIRGHNIAKAIRKESLDKVGKHNADIDNDGDVDKSDSYLINRRKAIAKAMQKEEVNNDSNAADLNNTSFTRYRGGNKPLMIKRNPEDVKSEDTANNITKALAAKSTKPAKVVTKKDGIRISDYFKFPKFESVDVKALSDKNHKEYKDSQKNLNLKTLKQFLDDAQLNEMLKSGTLKLHDGSSVVLTNEIASSLNKLLGQLSNANKDKMEKRLMLNKKSFDEIIAFAKEVV